MIQADAKAVRLVIVLLVLFHAAVALCYKVLFFSYYVNEDPNVTPGSPADGTPTLATTTQEAAAAATEAIATARAFF